MKITNLYAIATCLLAAFVLGSCSNKKFEVKGNITDAADSTLYFENVGLDGPVVLDSLKLSKDGTFSFREDAPDAPEFYRLRIAGQIINVSIDSTETVGVKASYPTMASQYEVEGSDNCAKIKELALKQMGLQSQINMIAQNPNLGVDAVNDSVNRVMEAYKTDVKLNYIFKEPMKAYAYYALFQTVVFGNTSALIFNPKSSADDVKVFAAVATSWDTYHPKALRGENLHNIAIEGMRNVRIIRNKMAEAQALTAKKVDASGIIDISLPDNQGNMRRLSDLKGRVVLLDFHLFASQESTKRIMWLRDIYNKYHAKGLEIYQVSIDPDEHFWKTNTAALPWICVRDESGVSSSNLLHYNVQAIPTFFLLDKNTVAQKRDVQIQNLDAEIQALL